MSTHSIPLAIGTPEFQSATLASLNGGEGTSAAWARVASARKVADAIAEVHGDFAFAVTNAAGDVVMAV
ncbi:MAG: hypothetical protein JWP29_2911, partial [Rhodoferax sp.]|nr:hypothetical protein [Rhodoferax sp.]